MKRNIVRCLCPLLALILVFTFAAEPVAAAEDVKFINALDYDQVNDDGNFFYFEDSYTVNLSLPFETYVYYVDLVFTSLSSLSKVSSFWGSTENQLTVVALGDRLYRAYGNVRFANYATLKFVFTGTGSTEYVTLLSCRVCPVSVNTYTQNTTIEISNNDASNNTVQYYTGSSTQYVKVPSDVSQNNQFVVYLYPTNVSDWKKFDFWDAQLFMQVGEIDSISAVMGDIILPIEYNYLNDTSLVLSEYYVTVSVDLRDLIRTSSDYPMIIITGSYFTGQNRISMFGSTGSVVVADVDPQYIYFRDLQSKLESLFSAQNQFLEDIESTERLIYSYQIQYASDITSLISNLWNNSMKPFFESWLSSVQQKFEEVKQSIRDVKDEISNRYLDLSSKLTYEFNRLIDAIKGDGSQADDFNQDVQDKTDTLETMGDVFDSVTKPSVDDVQVEVSDIVSGDDVSGVTSVVSLILGNSYFLNVFMMAMIMATAGYVLYGKR